jgi:hypothetical protein
MDVSLPLLQNPGESTAFPQTGNLAAAKLGTTASKPPKKSASSPGWPPSTAQKPESGPPPGAFMFPNDPTKKETAIPPPVWVNPTPEQYELIKHDVQFMWERLIPSCLSIMMAPAVHEPAAALVYLHRFITDAGDTKDPVLRVLLEQLAMAHLRLAKLNVEGSKAQGVEVHKVLNAAAARLLSEIRKLALAIKTYREPAASKSFAVIQQQNVAHEQQVSYTQQTGPEAKETLKVRDTKLAGNGRIFADEHQYPDRTQPKTRRSRSKKPVEAGATQS